MVYLYIYMYSLVTLESACPRGQGKWGKIGLYVYEGMYIDIYILGRRDGWMDGIYMRIPMRRTSSSI